MFSSSEVIIQMTKTTTIDPKSPKVPSTKRASPALKVYMTFYKETESFEENNIGSNLAYLMGAILLGPGNVMNLDELNMTDVLFKQLLETSGLWASVQDYVILMND